LKRLERGQEGGARFHTLKDTCAQSLADCALRELGIRGQIFHQQYTDRICHRIHLKTIGLRSAVREVRAGLTYDSSQSRRDKVSKSSIR